MSMVLRLGSLALILVCSTIARGDALPGPPPNSTPVKSAPKPEKKPAPGPTISVPVDISYVEGNGNIAGKITIPVSILKALTEKTQINKSGTLPLTTPIEPTSGYPHGGTIIAGLALSLAMLSMVYLARRPAKKWALPGTVAVLLVFGVTGYLWANLAIPDKSSLEPPRTLVVPPQHAGKMVLVEITENRDRITITVPAKAAD